MAHRTRSVLPLDGPGSGRTTPRRARSNQAVNPLPVAGQLQRTASTRTVATETLEGDTQTQVDGEETQVEATQASETLRSGQQLSAMSSMSSYIGGAQPVDDDEWAQRMAPIRRMESLLGPNWDQPEPTQETQTARDVYCDDLRAEAVELRAENDSLRAVNLDLNIRLEKALEDLARERALRTESDEKLEEVEKAFEAVHQMFRSQKRRRRDDDDDHNAVEERTKRARHD